MSQTGSVLQLDVNVLSHHMQADGVNYHGLTDMQRFEVLPVLCFQTPGNSQLTSSMSHGRKVITDNDVDRYRASPVVEEYP